MKPKDSALQMACRLIAARIKEEAVIPVTKMHRPGQPGHRHLKMDPAHRLRRQAYEYEKLSPEYKRKHNDTLTKRKKHKPKRPSKPSSKPNPKNPV